MHILLLKFVDLKLHVFAEPKAQEVDWMKAAMDFPFYLYCGKAQLISQQVAIYAVQ